MQFTDVWRTAVRIKNKLKLSKIVIWLPILIKKIKKSIQMNKFDTKTN